MKRNLRFALAVAFLVAVTAVTASAMAFTGHNASAKRPSVSTKATPAALNEQTRVDPRDSARHTGCSKRAKRLEAPDV